MLYLKKFESTDSDRLFSILEKLNDVYNWIEKKQYDPIFTKDI